MIRFRQGNTIRRMVDEDGVTWLQRVACLLLQLKVHTFAWVAFRLEKSIAWGR